MLDAWFARRDRPDNTIKMNTGAGKTLVGLLVLQSSLNEDVQPAVYVTPDNYLADQVRKEAKDLGIPVASDEDDPAFLAGRAILVTNVRKLFNGKSTFGVGTEKIPIGAVVIDDAHACLATVAEQFSLKIPVANSLYGQLLDLFNDELEKQSYASLLEVKSGDPRALIAVPYWAWEDRRNDVTKLVHAHRADKDVMWGWPLIGSVLPLCQCAFGPSYVEIAPRCLPIDVIPAFTRAKRKIYMTATLADDGILVTHFGADPNLVSDPIRPKGAGDIGDRMILAPQEITPTITTEEIKKLARTISKKKNVAVIVPSNRRALEWKPFANQILDKETIAAGVDALKKGHVGLSVLVNKYDGVDLPGPACELLIIDGVPEVYGLLERLELAKLSGTEIQMLRQVQKLEQGMGRGVRSSEDHCVVLLLGAKLTHRINNPEVRAKFTSATQAQLRLGREVSNQAAGLPLSEIVPILELCLNHDDNWVAANRRAVAQAPDTDASFMDPSIPHIRRAFDLARQNKFEDACSEIEVAANAATEDRAKGFYKEMLAEYMHRLDPAKSQEILSSAISLNRRVTMPVTGIRYKKLDERHTTQAKRAVEFLSKFRDGNELIIWTNALLEDLRWDPEATDEFETAVDNLGMMLGFDTQRPEREIKKGPDNLWSLGELKFLVIECKSGATSPRIAKKDCDQLTGHMEWFAASYDRTCTATPIMIHPSNSFEKHCAPRPDTRIVDDDRLTKLKDAVRQLAIGLAAEGAYKDDRKVAALLQHFELTAARFVEVFTCKFKIDR